MPNLVSLTHPSLRILDKTQTEVFPISESLIHKNCHNFRPRNDIDMKLDPVTKFDKRKERQQRQKI